jgi:hypothetical protein
MNNAAENKLYTLLYAAPEIYTFKDKIKVSIYDDLEIDFNSLEL